MSFVINLLVIVKTVLISMAELLPTGGDLVRVSLIRKIKLTDQLTLMRQKLQRQHKH